MPGARPKPQVRATSPAPIGVIDIGSNSIRLVVYDKLGRAPMPLFNEKVLCGLGRDLPLTNRLSPDGVTLALANLERFARLVQGMGVRRIDVLATAAVREAEDGDAFVAEVARRCGLDIVTISGGEEARLAALGVVSGIPDAKGLVGDLGGGSLELVGLGDAHTKEQVTLPLGPFRLMAARGTDKGIPEAPVDQAFDGQPWIADYRGASFYPVGGAWRGIAKVHMERVGHPLRIIHHYTVRADELLDTAQLISRQTKASLAQLANVSKRRLETLPYGGLVMAKLLQRLQPKEVVFSAYGLREGLLYDLLNSDDQAADPLLAACKDIGDRLDRYGFGTSAAIAAWTAPLFPDETPAMARLREACGLVSDIGWADHPDYRAEHSYERVLRLPAAGIDHRERAMMAGGIYVRYGKSIGDVVSKIADELLDDEAREWAVRMGLALRLAHTLTGGATRLLERARLSVGSEQIELILPPDEAALTGDVVQRRLDALAKAMGRTGRLVVAPRSID